MTRVGEATAAFAHVELEIKSGGVYWRAHLTQDAMERGVDFFEERVGITGVVFEFLEQRPQYCGHERGLHSVADDIRDEDADGLIVNG